MTGPDEMMLIPLLQRSIPTFLFVFREGADLEDSPFGVIATPHFVILNLVKDP